MIAWIHLNKISYKVWLGLYMPGQTRLIYGYSCAKEKGETGRMGWGV